LVLQQTFAQKGITKRAYWKAAAIVNEANAAGKKPNANVYWNLLEIDGYQ
jgi:hypothetical protein